MKLPRQDTIAVIKLLHSQNLQRRTLQILGLFAGLCLSFWAVSILADPAQWPQAIGAAGLGSALFVAAAKRLSPQSSSQEATAAITQELAPVPRAGAYPSWPTILLLLPAPALAWISGTFLRNNVLGWVGWILWWAAIIYALGAAWWEDRNARWRLSTDGRTSEQLGCRRFVPKEVAIEEAAIVGGITLLALALRVVDLPSLPFGLWFDEGASGILVRGWLSQNQDWLRHIIAGDMGWGLPVFIENKVIRPAHFFLMAASFQLFGDNVFAIRIGPALVGVLTVPVYYRFVRSFFGWRIAMIAAFLLATSRWHINFSRISFDAVFVPILFAAIAFLFEKGLRERSVLPVALVGALVGLGMFTYIAFQMLPLLLGIYLLHRAVITRYPLRQLLTAAAIVILVAVAGAAPMIRYAVSPGNKFAERTTEASVFRGTSDVTAAILESTKEHLLMFQSHGDNNGRHNIPSRPMLDLISGAMVFLGVGFCLWKWKRPGAFIALAGVILMLLPGILSIPFEAPQALRSFGVLPSLYIFAAIPIGLLWQSINWANLRSLRYAGPAIAVLICAASASQNVNDYFNVWAKDPSSWSAFSTAETLIGYQLQNLSPTAYEVYASDVLRDQPSTRYLAPTIKTQSFDFASVVPVSTDKSRVLIFLDPRDQSIFKELAKLYPGGIFKETKPPGEKGAPVLYSVELDQQALTGLEGAEVSVGTQRDYLPALEAQSVDDLSNGSDARVNATLHVSKWGTYGLRFDASPSAILYIDRSFELRGRQTTQVELAQGNHSLQALLPSGSAMRVEWQPPNDKWTVVGKVALYRPVLSSGGLLGSYYSNNSWEGRPSLTRIDPAMGQYFHVPPLPRPYTVEWRGKLITPAAGRYVFAIEQISRSWLEIDGKAELTNTEFNTIKTMETFLDSGQHNIRLRFLDADGYSHIYLYWQPPGKNLEIIPSEYLLPDAPRPAN